jgi:rhamnose transport system ATP-binding protein
VTLLEARSLTKRYGAVTALGGVSLDLRAGEVHALVGENGAGKSTLVRLLTGASAADSGAIAIDGRLVPRADPTRMRALGVAAIHQQPLLFPDLTVAENLAIGFEPAGAWRRIDWRERRRRGAALLSRVGVALDLDAPVGTLGAAEQQLVEIARALGADARLLLLDEPTAALSGRETARLFDLLRGLRADGVAMLYISHRLDEVEAVADRVSVLRDGELVATRETGAVTRAELIRLMVGRDIQTIVPPRQAAGARVVLDVDGVGCCASGVHDVTLQLRRGEILGLAGLVGAGRTELARVLFGLTPADRGVVRVDGAGVRVGSPADAVRLGLAYVPEDRRRHGVIGELSVAANMTLASLGSITRAGLLDFARERAIATDYVRRFAIRTPSVDAAVATLSGGNQQKVALARWLAAAPRVLIVDEPTQGIDVGAKAEIHRLLAGLAEEGLAILLISSDLPEVFAMSNRIAVMCHGTIAGTLDRATATEAAILDLAFGRAVRH